MPVCGRAGPSCLERILLLPKLFFQELDLLLQLLCELSLCSLQEGMLGRQSLQALITICIIKQPRSLHHASSQSIHCSRTLLNWRMLEIDAAKVTLTCFITWVCHNPCTGSSLSKFRVHRPRSQHAWKRCTLFSMSKDVQPPKKPAHNLPEHVTAPEGTSLFRTVNFERYAVSYCCYAMQ